MRIAALLLLAFMVCLPANVFSQRQERDVPAEIDSARNQLRGAINDLNHAGSEWAGHKSKAIYHINEAIRELNEAEKAAAGHRR